MMGLRPPDIHETIIKAAADLISRDAPDYQYLAARLAIFHLRKKAFGQFEPPALYHHVVKMVELGKYDNHLLEDYTEEEFKQMDSFIVHDRDMTFSYAAVKQLEGKYLVQNRVTGEIYESAQFLYILVAACLFSNYPRETRLDYVKRFYDAVSTFKISLPTPIMSGVRTPTRQFSSCVLIEVWRQSGFHQRHFQRYREIRFSARRYRHQRWPHSCAGQPDSRRRGVPHRLYSVLQALPDGGEILLAGRRARRRGDTVLSDVAPGS
ncbi:Ribonucleotide reductase of class Ia (aerobic)alpha subunit [Salmonella enterica subsp. salamae]|uniref:Ribonucleotide reductase of class Ia (Aerobic)alpha subunit n=1 Tax=Salmonella enterica subsp. salamae TaxID=59202 RepID=A0A6D2G7I4_SALER|nr:Ribonucleotide reductase of class Ia (aerobic)alpha subunit [Salmonella enterica subsp. salamae]